MTEYYIHNLLSSGWINESLLAGSVLACLFGLLCLLRRNPQMALGMVETILMVAPLRAILNTLFLVRFIRFHRGGDFFQAGAYSSFANAIAIPQIEAALLACLILVPAIAATRNKQPLGFYCAAGILAANGATMIAYFTIMHPVMYARLLWQ